MSIDDLFNFIASIPLWWWIWIGAVTGVVVGLAFIWCTANWTFAWKRCWQNEKKMIGALCLLLVLPLLFWYHTASQEPVNWWDRHLNAAAQILGALALTVFGGGIFTIVVKYVEYNDRTFDLPTSSSPPTPDPTALVPTTQRDQDPKKATLSINLDRANILTFLSLALLANDEVAIESAIDHLKTIENVMEFLHSSSIWTEIEESSSELAQSIRNKLNSPAAAISDL